MSHTHLKILMGLRFRLFFIAQILGSFFSLRRSNTRLHPLCTSAVGLQSPAVPVEQCLGLTGEALQECSLETIGSYRVIRKLDHGGMGTVYLGQRCDDLYQQQVAIKVLHDDLMSRHLQCQLLSEGRILANLEHPNIARFIDAGTTDTGAPYLVMEYVQGQPIDEYCADRQLSVVECLNLFNAVCRAVDYAHRKLVVHRDLKPRNIVVTAEGVPKLLDFGIAKLLGQGGQVDHGEVTRLHVFSSDYASPELVCGKSISMASDVYSLGVILYQLMTGIHPYRENAGNEFVSQRVICEVVPPRPSQMLFRNLRNDMLNPCDGFGRFYRRKRFHQLRGDIDNIVMTALHKEPGQRYASAAHLSADIRRHLQLQPVQARAETWSYRGWRFVQRNKIFVAVGCLAFLINSAFAGMVISQAIEISRERDHATTAQEKAQREVEKTRAVTGFIQQMLTADRQHNGRPSDLTVKEVLDQATKKLQGRHALQTQPEVEATVRATIGQTYGAIGQYQAGKRELRTALAIYEQTLGKNHRATLHAQLVLSGMLAIEQHFEEAQSLASTAYRSCIALFGSHDPLTIKAANQLVTTYVYMQRYQDAVVVGEFILPFSMQVLGEKNRTTLKLMYNLAGLYMISDRFEDAEKLMLKTISIGEKLHGSKHPDVIDFKHNLAILNFRLARYPQAEDLFVEVVGLNDEVLGVSHPETIRSKLNLAATYTEQKKLDSALQLNQTILDQSLAGLGERHSLTLAVMLNMSALHYELGNSEKTGVLVRRAIAKIESADRIDLERRGHAYEILGGYHHGNGEYLQAKSAYGIALSAYTQLHGADHLDMARAEFKLAKNALELGDYTEAEPVFRSVLDRFHGELGWSHPLMIDTLSSYEKLLQLTHREEQAQRLREQLGAPRSVQTTTHKK